MLFVWTTPFIIQSVTLSSYIIGAKRKTVSVSARQSEGGSLPSNVNNSSSIYTYDGLFLYDDKYKLKKGIINPSLLFDRSDKSSDVDKELWRGDNTRRDYCDIYTTSCEINLLETASSSNSSLLRFSPVPSSLIDPDVIEECQAALLESTIADDESKQSTICDTISAEQERSLNDERSDQKIPKIPRINYTSHAELHINMENNNQSGQPIRSRNFGNELGSTIQFSQLDSKSQLLSPIYPSGCVVGTGKSSTSLSRPIGWFTAPTGMPGLLHEETKKSLDENGNSLQAFNSSMASSQQQNALKLKREKPKQKKADRNVKVIRSEEVVGHRNETNIDLLVKFIENDVNPKKTNGISKMGKGNYKSDYVNNKQRQYLEEKNKKKDGNRKNNKDLQRNLFKSSSLEEVSCSMLEDLTNHNSNITMRNKLKKDNNTSTNDRRSWGEVSYVDASKYNEVTHKNKAQSFEQTLDPNTILTNDSASCNYAEFAEFHVVTKKKKPKKYHNHNIFNDDGKINLQRNDYYHNHVSKYQENDFTGNDLYMNHCKIPEQRRKSTSSMPPSDKSDSSDLDSVHSLPVESTSKKLSVRQVSTSSGGTPQASYADIAKMANVTSNDHCNDIYFNPEMQDKWGTSQAKSMFPSLIESTTINEKGNHPKTMSLNNYNFPDLIESCHYYSEVQKKKESEEYNKEKLEISKPEKIRSKLKLSQSKSVDNEDAYAQNKNFKNDYGVTRSVPINKTFKENQKGMKTKSEICENQELINDSKATSCQVHADPKEYNKLDESNTNLIEVTNNKHEIKNSSNNSDKTTSDLVSDCIHHDNFSIKTNLNTNIDNKPDSSHYIPPVIILDEDFNLDEPSSNDIIFGFELNEKLLSGDLSDTDSSNTIIYQEPEISDASSLHDDTNVEQKENTDIAKLPSSDIVVKNDETTCNLPKNASELKNEKFSLQSAGHNKTIRDNQELKNEFRLNNKKCLNTIQFIPPTNASGFENHDKIVSFIGVAWDEILKGGTAQYYTG